MPSPETVNSLKDQLQVQIQDSTRPVYLHQTVSLDEDIAEELRKIQPDSNPSPHASPATETIWGDLQEVSPIHGAAWNDPWLMGLDADAQGRIYQTHIHHENGEVSTSQCIRMFSKDGKLVKEFASHRNDDFSVNAAGKVCTLDVTEKMVSIYDSGQRLDSRFNITLRPQPLQPGNHCTLHPVENGNSTEGLSGKTQWPLYLNGAVSVNINNSFALSFPRNGLTNGDFAVVPATSRSDKFQNNSEDQNFLTGNQFTASLKVTPSMRKDFQTLITHPNQNIICTHNVLSANEFGLGLLVWESSGVEKSFVRLNLPGGGGFSSYDFNLKAGKQYHFLITREKASYRFYIDGELKKSGPCGYVEEIAWSDIYIGGDVPASENKRRRLEELIAPTQENYVAPYYPEYFFQGAIENIEIIPASLSTEDLEIYLKPEKIAPVRVKIHENFVYVLEQVFKKIICFDTTGNTKKVFNLTGLADHDKPTCFSIDATGAVYVVVNNSAHIVKFTSAGTQNNYWFQIPERERYVIRDIHVHDSGLVYLPYQHETEAGLFICDTDGQLLFRMKGPSYALSGQKIIVNGSGQIFTERHYLLQPLTGSQFLADFRAVRWRGTCNHLLSELNYTRNVFKNLKRFYENKKRELSDSLMLDSVLEDAHFKMKESMHAMQEAESNWESFKNFLFSNGISSQGSENDIADRVEFHLSRNKFMFECIGDSWSNSGKITDIRNYHAQEGQYVDQYGVSLELHVKRLTEYPDPETDYLLLIPIDNNDMESGRILLIKNPAFSGKKINPVSCFFREEYKIDLSWLGISLGEYNHSINLLPGEVRDIKITTKRMRSWETTTTISTKDQQKRSGERDQQTKRTDDFESKLHSELERNNNSIDDIRNTVNSSRRSDMNFNLGFDITKLGLGLKANASDVTTNSSTYDRHYKKNLDTVTRNVKDLLNKTSTEISENNKVTFSEESTTETSHAATNRESVSDEQVETIKVHNPNMGRTVNYHFFQIMNLYGTALYAENALMHFDTGIEIISGTGITSQFSYSLAGFPRLRNDLDTFSVINKKRIMHLITAFVLRRYVRIENEALEGMPRIARAENRNKKELSNTEMRNLRKVISADVSTWRDKIDLLDRLYGMAFSVNPSQVSTQDEYMVNSGRFFVDAQVGSGEGVEDYLITRRDIETASRKARIDEVRERTRKGEFFQKLPDTLTHLNYNEKERG